MSGNADRPDQREPPRDGASDLAPASWLTRRAVAAELHISVATLRRRERDRTLIGQKDAEGRVRFDPVVVAQFKAALKASRHSGGAIADPADDQDVGGTLGQATPPSPEGALYARAFTLFGNDTSLTAAVIELQQPLAVVQDLFTNWCLAESGFAFTGAERKKLEAVYAKHLNGPYACKDAESVIRLVDTVLPLRQVIDKSQARVRQLEAHLAEGREAADQSEQDIEAVTAERDQLQIEVDQLGTALKVAQGDVATAAAQHDEVLAVAREIEEERDDFRERNQQLETRCAASDARATAVQAQLATAQAAAALALENATMLLLVSHAGPDGLTAAQRAELEPILRRRHAEYVARMPSGPAAGTDD
jgi:hypothetical protein